MAKRQFLCSIQMPFLRPDLGFSIAASVKLRPDDSDYMLSPSLRSG
jgi:hypothetical protein